MGTAERELTFGEKAVGLTFNPSGDPTVKRLKRNCTPRLSTFAKVNAPKLGMAKSRGSIQSPSPKRRALKCGA